jgi:hypothetical protein
MKMDKKSILQINIFALVALALAACSSIATPTTAPTPTNPPNTATVVVPSNTTKSSASAFETKSNSGGSVDVAVTPQMLGVGQPLAFEIAMNTHSVDLSDDMTQIVTLRDDQGKEYTPTAWEGAGPGGHHRSGVIKFAALASKPKSIDLIIKGLAKVSERTFHWDLP